MSTNTGRAPTRAIEPAVAKNENGVVTTSSPGPTSEGHQGGKKRIRARRHADGVRDSKKRFELALEGFNLGTEDEVLRIADARESRRAALARAGRTVTGGRSADFLARQNTQ
jgi:hypothetical protein